MLLLVLPPPLLLVLLLLVPLLAASSCDARSLCDRFLMTSVPFPVPREVGPPTDVLGIDCEMVGVGLTGETSALARVSIVNSNCQVVYVPCASPACVRACVRAYVAVLVAVGVVVGSVFFFFNGRSEPSIFAPVRYGSGWR